MTDRNAASPDRGHPAARALTAAIRACDGALDLRDVAVCACVYPASPRRSDPGPWASQPVWGANDAQPFYPASVMKLFLLAAMWGLQAEGRFSMDTEDARAAAAMIRLSSNEASAYLMGRISGAPDGPTLDEAALADWLSRRRVVQDWFQAKADPACASLQLLHATYQDSPYGCAFQARKPGNGNLIAARAGAALMHDITRGALPGSRAMMALLERSFQRVPGYGDPEGDQVRGFLAQGLPAEVSVWSKAGHTSTTRHDLLFAECPQGPAFVLSVMTAGTWTAAHDTFLPAFARHFYSHACGPVQAAG